MVIIDLPQPYPTPSGQASQLEIARYTVDLTNKKIDVHYFPGNTVSGQWRRDVDFANAGGLHHVIQNNDDDPEYDRFAAWAISADSAVDAPMYGALFDIRSIMRWIGWRQFRERLGVNFEAAKPQLIVFLGTQPPEEA